MLQAAARETLAPRPARRSCSARNRRPDCRFVRRRTHRAVLVIVCAPGTWARSPAASRNACPTGGGGRRHRRKCAPAASCPGVKPMPGTMFDGREGRLLDLREVVIGIAVQLHHADLDQRVIAHAARPSSGRRDCSVVFSASASGIICTQTAATSGTRRARCLEQIALMSFRGPSATISLRLGVGHSAGCPASS